MGNHELDKHKPPNPATWENIHTTKKSCAVGAGCCD